MNKYIGVKLIEAEPMNDIDFESIVKGWPIKEERKPKEGYKVVYPNGYVSWCPKEIFEKANLMIDDNKDLPSGVSVGLDMVDSFIKETYVSTIGDKTTLVRAILVNGFEMVESSSCVDVKNYSQEIGEKICMGSIKDKIWMLLGFLLQTAVSGVK